MMCASALALPAARPTTPPPLRSRVAPVSAKLRSTTLWPTTAHAHALCEHGIRHMVHGGTHYVHRGTQHTASVRREGGGGVARMRGVTCGRRSSEGPACRARWHSATRTACRRPQ
eukprot:4120437-Prymnesium_polylepis.2